MLNPLTGAEALVQDQLFATLDPTVCRTVLPDGTTVTLTDTVGFVRHLPHQLVDAFRPTPEEVTSADLVLHVVDVSASDATAQVTAVCGARGAVRGGRRRHARVAGAHQARRRAGGVVAGLQRTYPWAVTVSAVTREGLDQLREAIAAVLRQRYPAATAS